MKMLMMRRYTKIHVHVKQRQLNITGYKNVRKPTHNGGFPIVARHKTVFA